MKQLCIISVLLLCAVVSITAQEGVQVTKSEAANLVLNEILADKIGKVDIHISNSPVALKDGFKLHNKKISCPYSSNWVVFVDDYVFANWEHPCRYIFINSEKKEFTVINDVIFPANMEDFEKLSGVQFPPKKLQKINKVNKEVVIQTVTQNPHYYAVIINGGVNDSYNYIRYWNDISSIFCTLTQVYGYMPENIYVHSTDGTAAHNHGSLDLDNDETADIDLPASKSSISSTFQTLANTIVPDDQLFVFVTDHGGRDANGSYIYLWGTETLTTSELKQMLAPINTSEIINVMEQCYSGGFVTDANNITGSHRVVQTACNATEYSWAEVWITGANYDEFVFYWTAAARGYYPGTNAWELGDPTGSFPFDNYFSSHPADYNPDTNGDGVVQMQEAFNYANNFDTWSSYGFYYPYYSGYSETPTPNHNIGFQEDLLSLKGISGNITSTQTVSGNFLVSGNLSIQSGIMVSVNPLSNFYFLNGASLNVNGTLNANGTSSDEVVFDFVEKNMTVENGIKINSGATANFTYAIIKNAYKGILSSADVNLSHCEILNCSYGLFLWSVGLGSTIDYCNIHNNSITGIHLYNSSPEITNSAIKYNNYVGVKCENSSSPKFGKLTVPGYNNISNNGIGVYAFVYSYPFIGEHNCFIDGGFNKFYDNVNYHIKSEISSFVLAEDNYWTPLSSSKFLETLGGTIDYQPYLSEPPFGMAKASSNPEELAFDQAIGSGFSYSADIAKPAFDWKDYYNDEWPIKRKLNFAKHLIGFKITDGALKICKDVITKNPDSTEVLYGLHLITEAAEISNIDNANEFFKLLYNTKSNKEVYGLAGLMLGNISKDDREEIINQVIERFEGKNIAEVAYYQKVLYTYHDLNDIKQAQTILEKFQNKYPNSVLAVYARDFINGIDIPKSKDEKSFKQLESEDDSNIPLKYALLGNYPNPFNPETKIRYGLPFDSNIEFQIFDVTGRILRSFKIDSQSKGYYDFTWDGRNESGIDVSSGVYLYRLTATSIESMRVFSGSGKMMMLR
ncbi:MAG: T9SS type A sorting domain-containing protein [Bacteroidetes bacterium]|nr:T9SS type A sorting domain-containing protein [Bacteroidota bacterium]